MSKYLNVTFQLNKYKKSERDAHWVGYSKEEDGSRFYFVKIFKNNGQYGEYLSASIDMEKLSAKMSRISGSNPTQEPDNNFQEEYPEQEFPKDFPI